MYIFKEKIIFQFITLSDERNPMRKSDAQCIPGLYGREKGSGYGPPTCLCSDDGKWKCATKGREKKYKNGL